MPTLHNVQIAFVEKMKTQVVKNNESVFALVGRHNSLNSISSVIQDATEFAVCHGICKRGTPAHPERVVVFGYSLLPMQLSAKCLNTLYDLQPRINFVQLQISRDLEFLENALSQIKELDEFTSNLLDVAKNAKQTGFPQRGELSIFRSDYFIKEHDIPKQIEVNTIASGCGALCTLTRTLHEYILQQLNLGHLVKQLPSNSVLAEICGAFKLAWQVYGSRGAILFLVHDEEKNICDQRHHEFEFERRIDHARVLRRTFLQLEHSMRIDECSGILFVDNIEIAVVYYRTAYDPSLMRAQDWNLRLQIERSVAIKCPTVAMQLSGCKRIQQELTKPKILERFIDDVASADKLRQTFVAQYALDMNPEGDKAVALGLENPSNFVLKPQREGGGHNFYDENLRRELERVKNSPERQKFILMERIQSRVHRGFLIQNGRHFSGKPDDVTSELGIFGAIVTNTNKIVDNITCGYLLRSKPASAPEGGVATGAGVLDSLLLL